VPDHRDLFASSSAAGLIVSLRIHDEFDHGRDVLLRNLLDGIVEEVLVVVDRVVVYVANGVTRASDVSEPHVVALLEESCGQEGLVHVSTPVVKPGVRVLREAI